MAVSIDRPAPVPLIPSTADIRAAFGRVGTVQEEFRALGHIHQLQLGLLTLASRNLKEAQKELDGALDQMPEGKAKECVRRGLNRVNEALGNVNQAAAKKSAFAQACTNFADLVDMLHGKLKKVLP